MNASVVVIGGGPAGAACTYELARAGVAVTVLERNPAPRPKLGETCAPSLERLLNARGLHMPTNSYLPLSAFASSWGSAELEYRNFTFWSARSGVVLDRAAVEAWLLRECQTAGAVVMTGCSIEDVREQSSRADFIVEATGRSPRSVVHDDVRRWYTDDLTAVVATFPAHRVEQDSVAMIESCELGWWYAARLPNGTQHVMLFTDADLIAPPAERVGWFLRKYERTRHLRVHAPMSGEPVIRVSDARTGIRNVLWRDRWLCIGDAAWCLDPLSGRGIERAVQDGIDAAAAILAALDDDIGAVRAHAALRANTFLALLETQRSYYAAEARWPDRPFWRRRSPAPQVTPHGQSPVLAVELLEGGGPDPDTGCSSVD